MAITIEGRILKALERVTIEHRRMVLTHVNVRPLESGTAFEATDGRQALVCEFNSGRVAPAGLIPRERIKAMRVGDLVTINDDGTVRVEREGREKDETFNLLEGNFPPVEDVIPRGEREPSPVIGVHVNGALRMMRALDALGRGAFVRWQHGGKHEPIRFDVANLAGCKVRGVMMPCVID